MSNAPQWSFSAMVPGFDFLQNLVKGASGGMGQMPHLASWVAPTIDVQELQKRIDDLKAVQFWLEQNGRALAATVQALEVQKKTLSTLKNTNAQTRHLRRQFRLLAGQADDVAHPQVAVGSEDKVRRGQEKRHDDLIKRGDEGK